MVITTPKAPTTWLTILHRIATGLLAAWVAYQSSHPEPAPALTPVTPPVAASPASPQVKPTPPPVTPMGVTVTPAPSESADPTEARLREQDRRYCELTRHNAGVMPTIEMRRAMLESWSRKNGIEVPQDVTDRIGAEPR